MNRKYVINKVLVFALGAVLLTGCGASSAEQFTNMSYKGGDYAAEATYDTGYYEDGFYEAESLSNGTSMKTGAEEVQADYLKERKLIKTVDMDVETKEFEALMSTVEKEVNLLGGYIENVNSYNGSNYSGPRDSRSANITARIPQHKLKDFLDCVSGVSNVTRRSENVNDVTLQYVDLESHRDALKVEHTRLLVLLERADSLEDILVIEERLTNVRYQLESMESQLRTMDNKVNFSTVYLSITEVKELTPVLEETVWERISKGFVRSIKNICNAAEEIFVGLIIVSPYIVVWIAFILVVTGVVKLAIMFSRNRANKKAAKGEQKND